MEFGRSPKPRSVHHYLPPWRRAPRGLLAGVLPLELVLARHEQGRGSGDPRLYGYPEGFEIYRAAGNASAASDGGELDSRLHNAAMAGRLAPDEQGLPPPEMLRLPSSSPTARAWRMTMPVAADLQVKPSEPVMYAQGGGGAAGNWRQSLWIWPLPPAGALTFICEWPGLQIPVTRRAIDAHEIHDAAARAQVLFSHRACRSRSGDRIPNRTRSESAIRLLAAPDSRDGRSSRRPTAGRSSPSVEFET